MGLPASSPGLLDRATAADRAARVRYRRALMLMVMTLVIPGSAQLSPATAVGRIATRLWAALLGRVPRLVLAFHHQYVSGSL